MICSHRPRTAKKMEKLLIVLWLAMLAITGGGGKRHSDQFGLSELERKTLDIVVEEFNSKSNHQHAYKATSVQRKEEEVMAGGKTVTLDLTLRSTTCKKENFKPETCLYRRGVRPQLCVACFKYEDMNPQPQDKFWDCISTRTPTQERRNYQQQKCEDVKTVHMIGQFSFLKAAQHE